MVTIRGVTDPREYWRILDVMKDAWSMKDYTEAVPPHLLRAAEDNGGLLLVAYEKGNIIGFVFGIPGIDGARIYHYSHMLGVKKEYRGKGIAYKLKLAQRKWALERGYRLIIWTFDPYQGLNAKFNFSKLGVICNVFRINYYDQMMDGINRGMVTDRFKVEWWIGSERVRKRLEGRLPSPNYEDINDYEHIVTTYLDNEGIRRVRDVNLNSEEDVIILEIPGDLNALKTINIEKANEWKLKLRPAFSTYFKRGYYVIDLVTCKEGEERRNYYVLWRRSLESILSGEVPWK
ncbi:MAG: hypothetical protein DRJ41_05075 [Thermoprotei archaeon]|nr:MAG: hypothetical protein DRJ41_05075 [Thermoprotei archaeon]